jgi:N-acetylglucosaminyldiphosphoundecaprenol N-acetyl-beta-D-mannosaminyltransferase
MHYRSLRVPLSAGVGGTIDFLAGRLKRAPGWVQHIGAEWLFRLIQEPRRLFRRYVKDMFVFGKCLWKQWWLLRLQQSRSRKKPTRNNEEFSPEYIQRLGQSETCQWLALPERFDVSCVLADPLLGDNSLANGLHCILDASRVTFLDSTGVGRLIRLSKHLQASGAKLVLLAPSAAVLRVLKLMHLREFFLMAPNLDGAHLLIRARTREETATVALRVAVDSSTLLWRGEITAANAKAVWKLTQAHLAGVLGQNPCKLDLSAVRFIDSTGLGLLVRAKKFARKQNVPLALVGIQPAVRNVLRLAQMEDFLLEPTTA